MLLHLGDRQGDADTSLTLQGVNLPLLASTLGLIFPYNSLTAIEREGDAQLLVIHRMSRNHTEFDGYRITLNLLTQKTFTYFLS